MVGYEKAVFTYIDVLGFRDLVARLGAQEVADVLGRFETHSAPHFGVESDRLSYVAFSDLIVRVSPLTVQDSTVEMAERLITEASDVAAAQSQLCQKGIVIRGAITSGAIYASGSRIFGPALIQAYELESKHAIYPRVILDPDVAAQAGLPAWVDDPLADAEDFERHVLELGQYFSRDTDGAIFVDYLGAMCSLGNDGTPEEMAEEAILFKKHGRMIEQGLRSPDLRILQKYQWMRDYHNSRANRDWPSLRL